MFLAENQQRIGAKIMTDKTGLTDLTREYATHDSPQAHRVSERRRWTDVMMHRWPAALGIAVAALTAFDLQLNVEFVSFLSALVVVMALVYVGAAILERRNYAWVVFLAAFAVLALTQVLDLKINLPLVYLVVALAFVMLGVARGQLRRPRSLTLQAPGMLTFGAIALVACCVDPDSGGHLVAFALIGHAAWDAVHYVQNRVVARSYAEFCAVLDLLVGAAILLMA
jgi:hypothetical protein